MLLAATVTAFSFLPNEGGVTAVILLLALFAVAGICSSFAFAAGLLRFSGSTSRNDLTKLICDGNAEGQLVIGAGGKIIYANEAYMASAGADRLADVRAVEPVVLISPEISRSFTGSASRTQRQGKCRGSAFVAAS